MAGNLAEGWLSTIEGLPEIGNSFCYVGLQQICHEEVVIVRLPVYLALPSYLEGKFVSITTDVFENGDAEQRVESRYFNLNGKILHKDIERFDRICRRIKRNGLI